MDNNTTNAAVLLFRQQVASPPVPSFHPFQVLCSAIRQTPGLNFSLVDTEAFKTIPKKQLSGIVWKQQYRTWYDTPTFRNGIREPPPSLSQCYPRAMEEKQVKQIPHYLHYDHPSTASRRARLRFGRALLCQYMHRFRFHDTPSPKCLHCNSNLDETVEHLVSHCTQYITQRRKCVRVLDLVLPVRSPWSSNKLTSGPGAVTAPETFIDSNPKKYLPRILYVTGKYIDSLQQLRKF
jgi:hypothetical protein